ncbi:DUF2235 domain-containing protein [Thiothrix fructosivorans]|uniref:DUF2235 domain-containing protein n=1 Tax=Thiothrix fructosivorans TaxID=111770 RepID=A0ABS3ILA7_9GAMM|nr:DUF2235 domain-containing protein [Thiothrix fructosivorans]
MPYFPLDNLLNRKYEFHDTKLSPIVRKARHAIALDEPAIFTMSPTWNYPTRLNRRG